MNAAVIYFQSYAQKRAFLRAEIAATEVRLSCEHEVQIRSVMAYDPEAASILSFARDKGSNKTRWLLNALNVALKETPDDATLVPNSWPSTSISFDPNDNRIPCWAEAAEDCGPDGLRAFGAAHGASPQRHRLNAALSRLHAKPISFASYLYFSGVAESCSRNIDVVEIDGKMIATVSPVIRAARNVSTAPLSGKPHLCYFIRITRLIDGGSIYKIGITSTSVAHRFHKETGIEITVLASWSYACKGEAEMHEKTVLREHSALKSGESAKEFLAHGGWTECFSVDVLGLDRDSALAA